MITIRRTQPHHAKAIHRLEVICFSDPWSLPSIRGEISAPDSFCLVALENDETVVGHATMRHIIDEGHINNISVHPSYRNRGIAATLVQDLAHECMRRGIVGMTLEVRVSNHAAIALYEKHGFGEYGRRKNYYDNPTEDAIIMWRYLCDS